MTTVTSNTFSVKVGYTASGVTGTIKHGETITIAAEGAESFGTKTQGPPILWDFGNDVWVNGNNNTLHSTKVDGDLVPTNLTGTQAGAEGSGEIWYNSEHNTSGGSTNPEFIVSDPTRPWRHNRLTHHYRLDNYRWFGYSWAHGNDRLDVPWTTGQYYWSGRYYCRFSFRQIRVARYTSLSGTFDTGTDYLADGETCTLALANYANQDAKIVYLDTSNALVYLQITTSMNTSSFPGSLTGQTSGATLTLPDSTSYSGPASTKLHRLGQGPANLANKTGMGSVHDPALKAAWIGFKENGVNSYTEDRYPVGYPALETSDDFPNWFLFEHLIDCRDSGNGSTFQLWNNNPVKGFDNSTFADDTVSDALQDLNRTTNPYLHTCGLDTSGSTLELPFDFGEIYIDDTPQRVMVGNAATKAACTEMEYFRPTAWSDTSITCVVNAGAFDDLSGKYLYVFDDDNNVESTRLIS